MTERRSKIRKTFLSPKKRLETKPNTTEESDIGDGRNTHKGVLKELAHLWDLVQIGGSGIAFYMGQSRYITIPMEQERGDPLPKYATPDDIKTSLLWSHHTTRKRLYIEKRKCIL